MMPIHSEIFKYLGILKVHMGKITVSVDDEVLKEFREAVHKKFGQGRSVFGKVINEAIKRWIEAKNKDIP